MFRDYDIMITRNPSNSFASRADAGSLNALDRHFARFITELSGSEDPSLFLAAALVSQRTREGHVCLDLRTVAGKPSPLASQAEGTRFFPELTTWRACLEASPVVGTPGERLPLILDAQSRLYLYRYWEYQRDVAAFIKERAATTMEGIDQELLQQGLNRYFRTSHGPQDLPPCDLTFPCGQEPDSRHDQRARMPDWQEAAAQTALTRKFCVITGGPGTGKTTTVARLLALLREQPQGGNKRIALAAPTGKAAARLEEAIGTAREKLDCPAEIKATIPTEASTLHRLLGTLPDSPYFRHDAVNPLAVDLVIVDEASMVDLALMAKLVRALPPQAGLILLGDKDQLASVEAGAVLGDICHGGSWPAPAPAPAPVKNDAASPSVFDDRPSAALAASIVELRDSYRFSEHSRIARVSRAIRSGDGDAVLAALQTGDSAELAWDRIPAPGDLAAALTPLVLRGFTAYLEAATVKDKFAAFERFRILCALRRGPYGLETVNTLVERILRDAGLIGPGQWYCGRPLLITQNDYNLRLFNGDIGLVLPSDYPLTATPGEAQTGESDTAKSGSGHLPLSRVRDQRARVSAEGFGPADGGSPERSGNLDPTVAVGAMRVFFPAAAGPPREFLPARLPPHETVYAMTVHKSQGSEFDQVLLLLPDRDAPILTRELIYTGITRARHRVTLWGREDVLRTAVGRRVQRSSGLRDALWGT